MSRRTYTTITLTVAAGATVRQNITGGFLSCLESNLSTFELAVDGEPLAEFRQGFELRTDGDGFALIEIRNPNDVALVVTLAVGRGRLIDRRFVTNVPGGFIPVTLEDVAAKCFMGVLNPSGSTGNFVHGQFWNPAASGKLVLVRRLMVGSDAAAQIAARPYDTALTNKLDDSQSIYIGGAAGVCELRHVTQATLVTPNQSFFTVKVQANTVQEINLSAPIAVPAGKGLLIENSTDGASLSVSAELVELDG